MNEWIVWLSSSELGVFTGVAAAVLAGVVLRTSAGGLARRLGVGVKSPPEA